MWFCETGVIYWVGNTKTNAKLVLPKHDILTLFSPSFLNHDLH